MRLSQIGFLRKIRGDLRKVDANVKFRRNADCRAFLAKVDEFAPDLDWDFWAT